MTNFALHTVLLLLIALFAGCIVGCVLRLIFRRDAVATADTDAGRQPDAPVKPAVAEQAPEAAAKEAPKAPPVAVPQRHEKVDAPAEAGPDDLKVIKGIGNAIEQKLNTMGVTRLEQIAGWTRDDIERFDEQLAFRGRIEREAWVAQAKKLTAND